MSYLSVYPIESGSFREAKGSLCENGSTNGDLGSQHKNNGEDPKSLSLDPQKFKIVGQANKCDSGCSEVVAKDNQW